MKGTTNRFGNLGAINAQANNCLLGGNAYPILCWCNPVVDGESKVILYLVTYDNMISRYCEHLTFDKKKRQHVQIVSSLETISNAFSSLFCHRPVSDLPCAYKKPTAKSTVVKRCMIEKVSYYGQFAWYIFFQYRCTCLHVRYCSFMKKIYAWYGFWSQLQNQWRRLRLR